MFLGNANGELSVDILWQVLDALHIVPSGAKYLTQPLHNFRPLTIPYLYHVSMSVILRTVKALVLQLSIIPHAIYHNLHVSCLPMLRHATRHRLKQVMKLHWNLKFLTQSGTSYEF